MLNTYEIILPIDCLALTACFPFAGFIKKYISNASSANTTTKIIMYLVGTTPNLNNKNNKATEAIT